jgi:hypothetical protein
MAGRNRLAAERVDGSPAMGDGSGLLRYLGERDGKKEDGVTSLAFYRQMGIRWWGTKHRKPDCVVATDVVRRQQPVTGWRISSAWGLAWEWLMCGARVSLMAQVGLICGLHCCSGPAQLK